MALLLRNNEIWCFIEGPNVLLDRRLLLQLGSGRAETIGSGLLQINEAVEVPFSAGIFHTLLQVFVPFDRPLGLGIQRSIAPGRRRLA